MIVLSCNKKIICIIKRNIIKDNETLKKKNNGDFYCLNDLHSFEIKNIFESY